MKGTYMSSIAAVFLCMVLFPLFSMKETVMPEPGEPPAGSYKRTGTDFFRVLMSESGEIVNVSADDYVIGVISAEMSAESPKEALKAQAVAAYTFACRRRDMRKSESYDISDDSGTDQAYLSAEAAKERFKDNYDKYNQIITAAVNEVSGEKLIYDGKPALTVYHSISGGRTESAENVWGKAYPYLVAVESVSDMLSPDYLSTVTVSTADAAAELQNAKVTTDGNPEDWFGEPVRSDSGTVLNIPVCGTSVGGSTVRNMFSLRSSDFDVTFADGTFTFSVRGYGHGVGMSQCGAKFLASEGSSYKEILAWYYPGCTLDKP